MLTVIKNQFKYNPTDEHLHIYPELQTCSLCHESLQMEIKKEHGIVLLSKPINCRIYVGKCLNNECVNKEESSFDGCQLGYINYQNSFIIGIELVKDYLNLFSYSGLPFSAWWKNHTASFLKTGNPLLDVDRNWKSYCGKMHEAFCIGAEKFEIPLTLYNCCQNPKTLLMDGVVASIKAVNMPTFKKLWVDSKITGRCTKRSERQFPKLTSIEKTILEKLEAGEKIGTRDKNLLESSTNIGIKAISKCLIYNNRSYILKHSAKLFATFLCKTIASIKSLISNSCVHIIEK